MFGDFLDGVMVSHDEVEVYIVFPLGSAPHGIRFHRRERKKRGDFDDSVNVMTCLDIKRIVEESSCYIVNNTGVLSFFIDMKDLPAGFTRIEDGLYDVSLEIFPPEKIEIDTLTVSEMERYSSTTDHIKTPLSSFTEHPKEF